MTVQDHFLETRMTEIEQARSWSPRVVSKFETLIRDGEDLSLYRVNPLAFARDRGIAEAESIDLFLHATRSGYFRCIGTFFVRNPEWCWTASKAA